MHSNGGRSGCGRGRARTDGRGGGGSRSQKVNMNGVDVTDVTRNLTSEEWEKLKHVGGHTYVYQRTSKGTGMRFNIIYFIFSSLKSQTKEIFVSIVNLDYKFRVRV